MRVDLIPILEANGFVREGILSEHHVVNSEYVDSYVHAFIL